MIVYAVDPGLASGIALVNVPLDGGDIEQLGTWEMGPEDTEDFTKKIIDTYQGHDLRIVAENFKITAETGKKSQSPWSLELLGVIDYLCRTNGLPKPPRQMPGDAKSFAPNPRLKALGLWHKGGGGHALDALRHAVLYSCKNGYRSQKLLVD